LIARLCPSTLEGVNARAPLVVCSAAALLVVALATAHGGTASAAASPIPPVCRSCSALNRTYPHGLGKATARDRTSGTPPVTTFKRSNRLYRLAMSYNRGLDRDKDGIACEKA